MHAYKLPPDHPFERLAQLWEICPPGRPVPEEHLEVAREVYKACGLSRYAHTDAEGIATALGYKAAQGRTAGAKTNP